MEPEWNISYYDHDASKLGLNDTSPLIPLIRIYGIEQILRWLADYVEHRDNLKY